MPRSTRILLRAGQRCSSVKALSFFNAFALMKLWDETRVALTVRSARLDARGGHIRKVR